MGLEIKVFALVGQYYEALEFVPFQICEEVEGKESYDNFNSGSGAVVAWYSDDPPNGCSYVAGTMVWIGAGVNDPFDFEAISIDRETLLDKFQSAEDLGIEDPELIIDVYVG